jgi:hydroxylamine reductase (hybrid-cluster protein)
MDVPYNYHILTQPENMKLNNSEIETTFQQLIEHASTLSTRYDGEKNYAFVTGYMSSSVCFMLDDMKLTKEQLKVFHRHCTIK